MTTTSVQQADAEFEPALERTLNMTDDFLMAVAEAHCHLTLELDEGLDGPSPGLRQARRLVSTIATDLSDAVGACVVVVQMPRR